MGWKEFLRVNAAKVRADLQGQMGGEEDKVHYSKVCKEAGVRWRSLSDQDRSVWLLRAAAKQDSTATSDDDDNNSADR
jgi:hypothetical protein